MDRGRRQHRPLRPADRQHRQERAGSGRSTARRWPGSSSTAPRMAGDAEKLSTHMDTLDDLIREADFWAGRAGAEVTDRRPCRGGHRRADLPLRPAARAHPGGDPPRHHRHRDRGRPRRPGQRPGGAPARPLRLRPAQPDQLPGAPRQGRGGRHRARGGAGRAAALQGRADPRRPTSAAATPASSRCRCRRAWCSSSPTAASTATAPRRPSSTRCSRRWPRSRSGSRWRSPARSTSTARCRRSAASTRRSRASSTSAPRRGLTGEQGVLIPAANVQHLMLRKDVVEACARRPLPHLRRSPPSTRASRSSPASRRARPDDAGDYPIGSVNRAVALRLARFASVARRLARDERRRPGAARGEKDEKEGGT